MKNANISNPSWFIGVVENNLDQRHEGRVQVRAFGVHGTIDEVPTADLPWAIVLTQGGFDFAVIPMNSWVFGMFVDGRDAQQPIIIGVIPQQYLEPINPAKNGWGVAFGTEQNRLAQGSRPEDFGQPPVSRLARGENLEETYILGGIKLLLVVAMSQVVSPVIGVWLSILVKLIVENQLVTRIFLRLIIC
jgi:hypothetical protein